MKIPFRTTDDSFTGLINSYVLKRHILSNYYGSDSENTEYYNSDSQMIIKRDYDGFSRIYIMSDDIEETKRILAMLPGNCVINVPSRTGISAWRQTLEYAGFELLATYHRYVYRDYRKGSDRGLSFAEIPDIPVIMKMLRENFSPLTGHLPDDKKLAEYINNGCILAGRDGNGTLTGGLCHSIINKRCELPFWIDTAGTGLSLLYNMFYLCHQRDVRNITFWVNDENKETIRIHQLLGAKEDGMADYIFFNGKNA